MITRDNWKKSKSPWTFYKQTTKMYTKYKTQKTWLKRNNSQSNLSKSASHGLQNIEQPIKRKNQVTIHMEWLLSFLQLKSPTTLLKIFFFKLKVVKMIHRAEFYQWMTENEGWNIAREFIRWTMNHVWY